MVDVHGGWVRKHLFCNQNQLVAVVHGLNYNKGMPQALLHHLHVEKNTKDFLKRSIKIIY